MADGEVWAATSEAVNNNNIDEWGGSDDDGVPKRMTRVKKPQMIEREPSEAHIKSGERESRRSNKHDMEEWVEAAAPNSAREFSEKSSRDRGDDPRERGDRRDLGSRNYVDRQKGCSRRNSRHNSRGSRDRIDHGHQGRDRGQDGDRGERRESREHRREDRVGGGREGGRFYSPRSREDVNNSVMDERQGRFNDHGDRRDRGDYGNRGEFRGERKGSRDRQGARDEHGYGQRDDRPRARQYDDDRRSRFDRPRDDRRRRDDDDRGDRRGGRRGSRGGHDDRADDRPKRIQYIPPSLSSDKEVENSQFVQKGKNFNKYNDVDVSCTGPGSEHVKFIEDFRKSKLNDTLLARLKHLDFQTPTPVQKASIPATMLGRDIMACAQTGSGKTAAYLLPILNDLMEQGIKAEPAHRQFPQVLIISPTRELAIQIYDQCRLFAKDSRIVAQCLYGGTDVRFIHQKISESGCNVLIGTPGRINDFLEREYLGLNKLQYFVLDEADRMLDMGFGPIMKQLATGYRMPRPGKRKTLMFSATFPQTIQQFAADFMDSEYLFIKVGVVGGACADVSQEVLIIGSEESKKSGKLEELIKEVAETRQRTLVFVETKIKADFIACMLSQTNVPTTSIHGGRLQPERESALADFRSGVCPILVATSVAARGLDIPEVEHVINYELPREIEEYVHRIGRTGRCGNLGKSTSFYDPEKDCHLAAHLVKVLSDATQPVPDWLVTEAERAKSSSDAYRSRQMTDSHDLRQNPGYVKPPRREFEETNIERPPERRERRDRGDRFERGQPERRDRGDRCYERPPKIERTPPNTERQEPFNKSEEVPDERPSERRARPARMVPTTDESLTKKPTESGSASDEWGSD